MDGPSWLRTADAGAPQATAPAVDAISAPSRYGEPRVAVLIPCYNEEQTIAQVVKEFRSIVPSAIIYVYDNNSQDKTIEVASVAGAIVRRESLQGKGNVVRRMFADVDADIYVLVDGDATYLVDSAPQMIQRLIDEQLDMVVGRRVDTEAAAYRRGHRFGNAILTRFVAYLFGTRFTDILSGYRVLSRRFVKSFPAVSKGFETETELTVHALELRMPIAEVQTSYCCRPEGSSSKLSTYRDGIKILWLIVLLYKNERPFQFFGLIALMLASTSIVLGIPIVLEWARTGLVPRLPTALLAMGVMILAFLSVTAGLILDTVTRGRQELKRLYYLSRPPLQRR
jgi:glycosyltransferase involved in cell wall biosynthesis